MIRLARTLAWLRWRILVNSLRSGRRRDAFETLSRWGQLATQALWAVLLLPAAAGLALGAIVGGAFAADSERARVAIESVARIVLGFVTFGLVLAPLVRSVQGMGPKLERLLLLPVSRRALHAGDVIAQLSDPWVAIVTPAILLLPAGLAVGGAWWAACWAAVAGLLVLFALASIGALVGWGITLAFRDRRRGELLTLVLLAAMAMVGLIPAMWGQSLESSAHGQEVRVDLDRFGSWVRLLPSELYARVVTQGVTNQSSNALLHTAALLAVGALTYAGSSVLHRRAIEGATISSSRRDSGRSQWLERTLSFVEPPVAAVAAAFARLALRTVRGRMALFFTIIPLVLVRVIVGEQLLEDLPARWSAAVGPSMMLVVALVSLIALQPLMLNQFAVSGAGLTLECLSPLSSRQIVAGRLVGSTILIAIAFGLSAVGTLAVNPPSSPLLWIAAMIAGLASFVVLAPICAALSALFPKTADLGRIGRAGNPHAMASIAGVFLVPLAAIPGALVFAIAGIAANRPLLAALLSVVWLVLAVAIAYPLTIVAAAVFERRRENLLLIASGR